MSSERAAGAKPAPNPVTGENNNQQNKPNQFILWIKPRCGNQETAALSTALSASRCLHNTSPAFYEV